MAGHIPYLFLEQEILESKTLREEPFHHFVNVLRIKEQEKFFALDNLGNKFECIITKISKKELSYEISNTLNYTKPSIEINLIQAITKFEVFEEILDKATQLGINKITPVITDNITVSVDVFNKKLSRFNKIIKTASEQSQRVFLPTLENIINFKTFFSHYHKENTLIAYEKANIPIKTFFTANKNITTLNLFIGCEGGFSSNEVQLLENNNFSLVSISENILRAETAVIVGLSTLFYELT